MKGCFDEFFGAEAAERVSIYRQSDRLAAAYAADASERQVVLAELLVLTRAGHTVERIFAARKQPAPTLISACVDKLWEYQQGLCTAEQFSDFTDALIDYSDWLMDYFDDGVKVHHPDFMEQYHGEEQYGVIDHHDLSQFVINLAEVSLEIDESRASLRGIGREYLLTWLLELAAFVEATDVAHPEYFLNHDEAGREALICMTPSFEGVMRRINEDLTAALTADADDGDAIGHLKEAYQDKCFFDENQYESLYIYFCY